MNIIPLHSIVVLIGPIRCGKSTWASSTFENHEIIDADAIRVELCGDRNNHTVNSSVWNEIHRRTELRISLGQRVVIDATNLKSKDRKGFFEIADTYGVPLIYVPAITKSLEERILLFPQDRQEIEKSEAVYRNYLRDTESGDSGKASVVSLDAQVVYHPDYTSIPNNLLVVGDVHGNSDAMQRAIETATNKNLFLIWLGDVIDYGPHNLKCMKLAYDTIRYGKAMMILGNHERKLDRWITNDWGETYHGKLSESNKTTVNEILSLNSHRRTKFASAWNALNSWCYQHIVKDKFLFTHGAASKQMWDISDRRLHGANGNLAYFGQVDDKSPTRGDGYPNRIWNWVNDIPADYTVVVGHDWIDRVNNKVTLKTNSQGGRVFVVDCGSSKGGRLGSIIVDLKQNTIEELYFDG